MSFLQMLLSARVLRAVSLAVALVGLAGKYLTPGNKENTRLMQGAANLAEAIGPWVQRAERSGMPGAEKFATVEAQAEMWLAAHGYTGKAGDFLRKDIPDLIEAAVTALPQGDAAE